MGKGNLIGEQMYVEEVVVERTAALRVIALYVSPQVGLASTPVTTLGLRPNFGVVGDRHTGLTRVRSTGAVVENLRHFTAVTPRELAVAAESLGVPYIDPAWINANICFTHNGSEPFTTGMREGTRFYDSTGRAILEVKGQTDPCLDAGKMIASQFPHLDVSPERFPKSAIGLRGIYGIVLEEASIKLRDVLTASLPRE